MVETKLIDYYQNNFKKFGISEKSLGWTKEKQFLRFYQLSKNFSLNDASILDVGCGFGNILEYFTRNQCRPAQYTGIDIVEEFIQVAKDRNQGENTKFILGNYLKVPFEKMDYIVGSGIFGHRLFETDEAQYGYIDQVLRKSFQECNVGISFDFLSDKTDYHSGEQDFHASPLKVLELAYQFTRNIIFDNSCMPFEYSITLFKDDHFLKEKTVFNKFLVDHHTLLESGRL